MGTKSAVMYAFCSVFALVLQSVATQIKWHALRFMSGITAQTLMKMETGLVYTRVDTGSSLLCFYKDASNKDVSRVQPTMCDRLSEGITLQDAADGWCSPLLLQTFPTPCEGFKTAYFMGLATMMAMAINVLAIVVCLFLVTQYLEGTLHKATYRVWALILHITSTIILFTVYVTYILVAIRALDEVGGKGVPLLAMASKGTGMSLGVVVMGAGLLFQVLSGALLAAVKLGDEETTEEKQIRRLMKEDAARYAQEGGYVGDYGSYGYGSYGYGEPAGANYTGYGYGGYGDPNQNRAGGYPTQAAGMEMPAAYAGGASLSPAPKATS